MKLKKTIPEKLADLLDKQLLKALKDKPSAKILSVARMRCRDCGMTKNVVPGDPVEEMGKELGLEDPSILKMPTLEGMVDTAAG